VELKPEAAVKRKAGVSKEPVIRFVKHDDSGPNFGTQPDSNKGYTFTLYASCKSPICCVACLSLNFIKRYFRVSAEVVRIERQTKKSVLVEGGGFDKLVKKVSFSGNSIFSCTLLF
jgi:hypothetical protein